MQSRAANALQGIVVTTRANDKRCDSTFVACNNHIQSPEGSLIVCHHFIFCTYFLFILSVCLTSSVEILRLHPKNKCTFVFTDQ